jgi:integrase
LLKWINTRKLLTGVIDETLFICVDQFSFCDSTHGRSFTSRQHAMKRWCNRVGIKAFGWHAIRHFTATTLFNKGYPVANIQVILRHKSPNTTERYLHKMGLNFVREALEEGLKRDAEVISFPEKRQATSG